MASDFIIWAKPEDAEQLRNLQAYYSNQLALNDMLNKMKSNGVNFNLLSGVNTPSGFTQKGGKKVGKKGGKKKK